MLEEERPAKKQARAEPEWDAVGWMRGLLASGSSDDSGTTAHPSTSGTTSPHLQQQQQQHESPPRYRNHPPNPSPPASPSRTSPSDARYGLRSTPGQKAAPSASSAGASTSQYELVDEILGQGAYGTVLKARHKATQELLAAKVVPAIKQRPQLVRAEVALMQRLAHDAIVAVRDCEELAGGTSMVIYMELCEGGDMFARVRSAGSLSEDEARSCIGQALAAVGHLHALGVCHRDLKLENLLHDGQGRVKLTDFGLAIQLEEFATASDRWLLRACGSKSYSAPEVLAGQGYDGYPADMWSLGVCLFAMLSGFFPLEQAAPADWRFGRLKLAHDASASLTHTVYGFYERPCRLSTRAADLLDELLALTPSARLTAGAAAASAWVRGEEEEDAAADDGRVAAAEASSVAPRYRHPAARPSKQAMLAAQLVNGELLPQSDGSALQSSSSSAFSSTSSEEEQAPEPAAGRAAAAAATPSRPYYRSGSKMGHAPPPFERQQPMLPGDADLLGMGRLVRVASERMLQAQQEMACVIS